MIASSFDRLTVAVRALIRAQAPTFAFLGVFEYVVQASRNGAPDADGNPTTVIDAIPTDPSRGLPSGTNWPVRASTLGERVQGVQAGQKCRVAFLDGNPAKPVVLGLQSPSGTTTVDATGALTLGSSTTVQVPLAGGTTPVGRQGDLVSIILPPPAPPPTVSGVVNGALAFTGTMAGLPPGCAGVVTGGSTKVKA